MMMEERTAGAGRISGWRPEVTERIESSMSVASLCAARRELTDEEISFVLMRERQNRYRRNRYARDPEYRAMRIAATPEKRAQDAARKRERYANDPAYRQREIERRRRYR